MEDLKVPRVREGNCHPQILPYRKRIFLDLACRWKHPEDLRVSGRDLRGVLLTAEHFPPHRSRPRTGELSRERPLSVEYYAVFLDGTFLSIRRGKTAKEPVYVALGIKPDE